MTDKALLGSLKKHLRDTHGRYGAVTEACRVSESTVRRWVAEKRLPRNELVREALARFLNGGAK